MQVEIPPPVADPLELDAALFQAVLTAGAAVVSAVLYHRYRKRWFAWWTVAWLAYVARVGAIIWFLLTSHRELLLLHQVLTGWTALALLWTALVFSRGLQFRPWHLAVPLVPVAWSVVAVYYLDSFLLAAVPTVIVLSLATIGTGAVFLHYWRRAAAPGAAVIGWAMVLWGIHHLDYPFLRAQGAWAPWGYYLDIVFELAVVAGLMLLVQDDQRRGMDALSRLSADLQPEGHGDSPLVTLLERPLSLPGVHGAAFIANDDTTITAGSGRETTSAGRPLAGFQLAAVNQARRTGRPASFGIRRAGSFATALPLLHGERAAGVLLLTGDVRDPFTVLDDRVLQALGRQVAAALAHADLSRRLAARGRDLERLSARMVAQHEDERRRLSRELHDESAQLLSAIKIELGLLAESGADPDGVTRATGLVDQGIHSIRRVVNDLRPSLLDDLGLVPALRSLAAEVQDRGGVRTCFKLVGEPPRLTPAGELAFFRGLQEALTNVLRHAGATTAAVTLGQATATVTLLVEDDGIGMSGTLPAEFEGSRHMGLAGMRERFHSLGGSVEVLPRAPHGLRLLLRLPAAE
ncbi:MAG TPA: GAF domain-containing sensor histidine kinase [Gemmatimonadales bacterium]|nr:GAF domain-containing sensor histidine kinase [Gemmatimonadales bacterium]